MLSVQDSMQYPLIEQIGDPYLFVGREREFRNFGKWIEKIPRQLSKSRVILARRKSGKTAFVQRLFNQLWSANGDVIPFFSILPKKRSGIRSLPSNISRPLPPTTSPFGSGTPRLCAIRR